MSARTRAGVAFMMASIGLAVACERPGKNDILADYETLPSSSVPFSPQPPPAPASQAAALPSAAPSAKASASASASASGSTSSAAAAPPAKEWACGDKGKPDCPMQKWMKSVAAGAAMSGDTARLARAFNAMSKAPPGMGAWGGMCATGAAKANDGDFDGAKAMCKACHAKYQSAYHSRMRDSAWPLRRAATHGIVAKPEWGSSLPK